MSEKDYNKLTVALLKEELTSRGLETTGKKQDLVQRLIQADAEAPQESEMSTEQAAASNEEASMETGEEQTNGDGGTGEDAVLDGDMENMADEDSQGATEDAAAQDAGSGGEAAEGEEAAESEEAAEGEGESSEMGSGEGAEEAKQEGESQKEDKEEKEDEEPFEEDSKLMGRLRRRGIPFDMMKAKMDRIRDVRTRTLLAYPINHEDLSTDWLKEYLDKSQQFFIRFFEYDASKCTKGSLELRMKSSQDAAEAIEDLPKKKENLQAQLLKPNDVVDKILLNMKGVTEDPRTSIAKRMLVVEDLPSEPNEEALKDIFSDASYVFIPREVEGKMKGYAYAEYESNEKCREADKRLLLAEPELDGTSLFIRPMFVDDNNKIEVLTAEDREALKAKVAELKAQIETASKEEGGDEEAAKEKSEALNKELEAEQRKLVIDQHMRHAHNRMQKQYKRKQPYQHRGDPAKRSRQQNWGQRGGTPGNTGRGGPGFRRGGPPNLLDMPPHRGGPGGNPNAHAVQSLLVGLSQMLNTGPGRGGYPPNRGGPRGGSSNYQSNQGSFHQQGNYQRGFPSQGRNWSNEGGRWDNQSGFHNQGGTWGPQSSYGGRGGVGGGKWGGRGQGGMRGKFRR